MLGVSIDPCLSNGTNCTPAVYDALCQAFGFDMAGTEERGGMPPVLTKAKPGEAVWALTGEVREWARSASCCAAGRSRFASPHLSPPCRPPCALQYCLRAGVYSKTVPQDLESMPGAPCTKVDGLSCIRHAPCVEAWFAGAGRDGWVGGAQPSLAVPQSTTPPLACLHPPPPPLFTSPLHRTRETIISALDAANLAAFKPAPPTAEPAVPAGAPWAEPQGA